MSTAVSSTSPATASSKFADWRKARKLEHQSRNVASRQLKGSRLVLRYITLVVVAILMVGPLLLPLLAAFKAPGESVFGQGRGWTGRNIMYFVVLSAMIFPFESIMLSLYSMMVSIGTYKTLTSVWMVAMIGPFQILMMRAAFLGIPEEIEDAALIDGAGEWERFWRIFLPQVRGTLTVVGLTSFIGAWSDFLFPLLMLVDNDKHTLMLELTAIQNSAQGTTYQLVLAGAVVALVPVVVVFAFSQKYFFRGIEDGGLKF